MYAACKKGIELVKFLLLLQCHKDETGDKSIGLKRKHRMEILCSLSH